MPMQSVRISSASRRSAAVVAAAVFGAMALAACDDTAAPSSPTPGSDGSGGSAAPASSGSSGAADQGTDVDDVVRCVPNALSYRVERGADIPDQYLLTMTNTGALPCLLPSNDLVVTLPGLDGAADHLGPESEDLSLLEGESGYAAVWLSGNDSPDDETADRVEIALTAAGPATTVPITGDPAVVGASAQVTSVFGTPEAALGQS
ncbi:hypothetical protein SRB5_67260 [Streptomyces sp. RB5]|uniref:DUF4232 domain-containing protein n=1 Tax=Streptomyces smaragdinus TaxID=2585196 RepID=A0A7K0CSR0_9ACTN|nr:hypothetical protein [Streptomyces smaragdinus]MQY16527.1 hypothetical protein [Streptomyces smaragdinus]